MEELNSLVNNISSNIAPLIRDYDPILVLYILKTMTDIDNAMSADEITEQLNYLFDTGSGPDLFAKRTLRRKVDMFALTGDDDLDWFIETLRRFILSPLLGGCVEQRAADGINNGTNTRGKGSQRRYYFEPLLSGGDLDMIYGVLMSSRYLTESEKDYLISRLEILRPFNNRDSQKLSEARYRSLDEISPLPDVPRRNKATLMPMDSSVFLRHVNIIYEAMRDGYQIEIIYGKYDKKENSRSVDFVPRNPDKPYHLNPYAMLWNDGEYYLVATHCGFDNPAHFRVDRIISVKPVFVTENGEKKEAPRFPVPPILKKYFKTENGKSYFDAIAYANTYPGMKIFNEADPVTCVFDCDTIALQILVDNFGPDIRLSESVEPHTPDEVDTAGRPKCFLTATIRGIQRDNALLFCIEHADYIKLISPPDLADEVRANLRRIADEY